MGYFGIPIRNGLPIGLGSLVGFGIRSFEPSELFAAGEQGTWYDPSDFSTLFQDSAGTTPVTGVEQVVGLMLDKSKGLVLGSELVTTPYSGSVSGSWLISATSVTRNASATGQVTLTLSAAIDTTKRYLVSFTVANLSGDTFFYRLGGGGTAYQITANGTYTARVLGGATASSLIFAPWAGGAGEATITNITVRELPGNHATATGSARPTLSARVNLLTKTEDISNAVWEEFRCTKAANVTTAPDGTFTGDSLTETATAGTHPMRQAVTLAAGTGYTFSFYAKASTSSYIAMSANSSANNYVAVEFNLANGTVNKSSATGTWTLSNATITAANNGWYLCAVSFIVGAATSYIWINMSDGTTAFNTDGQISYAGSTSKVVFVWGFDVRVTNDGVGIPAYQRVNTATDYDTAGFPVYLAFGGAQAMSTPANVDFSGTDKMTMFAGVRKLSDAAQAVVAELSATIASNNGTFLLAAPDGATQTYGWDSKGTTQVDAVATGFAAPITNVVTGTADIAGDSCIIRVNGTVADTEIGDQGSGNFGSYPLFIGARNLASLFFTGRLYSLITRGAATDSASVAATEAWVNQRTAAY